MAVLAGAEPCLSVALGRRVKAVIVHHQPAVNDQLRAVVGDGPKSVIARARDGEQAMEAERHFVLLRAGANGELVRVAGGGGLEFIELRQAIKLAVVKFKLDARSFDRGGIRSDLLAQKGKGDGARLPLR